MTEPLRLITQTESWKEEIKENVVDRLKAIVSRAESGEIQGIAYAAVTIDGCIITGFTKTSNRTMLVGGLSRVQHAILASED